ncbi:rubrerythrin [Peptoclostridium acidaminophilum DSM 3953]|uniref:Rubrerythrin n=1 Tax=Peptoclostridium acidaminophilum DSM 3953 TaxID=1286171 RepID=W8U307_PEPAC|nr:rubrerythrin family protein [Peptoclostridium acidaminophilum]AHM55391.1 rubrerythrin [Peptoclostridium acidaminophilum DSM 3953]
MKSLKGTKTLENLMKAFAGESQARSRYTYFADVASEEGYDHIAEIFIETAENELVHADIFYNHMLDGMEDEQTPFTVNIEASYPAVLGCTYDNLKAAAMGENEEWTQLYPEFAQIAESEGFPEVAASFRMISKVEERHEKRYEKLAENVDKCKVFEKDEEDTAWKCRVCGYIHSGKSAPKICPVCKVEQGYFEKFCENY